ncbi:MAG: restriction endonuclease subunit S [Akkermansiaceae bacterium]
MSKLPKGWTLSSIGEACQIHDSMREPVNNTERHARITGKDSTKLFPYYGATGEAGKIDGYRFDGEYVLLGEDAAPFLEPHKGVAYLVSGKFWVNNHAHVLTLNSSNKYLLNYLLQIDYKPYITGTTRLKLNQSKLKSIPLPLPPLPEQKRIVAKLDKCQQRIEGSSEALAAIPELLENYRSSLLASAFRGDLTKAWRAEQITKEIQKESAQDLLTRLRQERQQQWQQSELQKYQVKGKTPPKNWKDKYKKPALPDTANLPSIPNCWQWANFDNLTKCQKYAMKAGPFGSALKKEFYTETGYKIYGQEQVIKDDPYFGNYFIGEDRYKTLESCKVAPGDLLVSLVGTIGKTMIVPKDALPGIINPRLVKISLDDSGCYPQYIQQLLASSTVKNFFKIISHGGTMDVLNMKILKSLPIPLPPLAEQAEIVRLLETAFKRIDAISALHNELIKQHTELTQSLLAKAFRGELDPQDSNDEPASEMLRRMIQENKNILAVKKPPREKVTIKKNNKTMSLQDILPELKPQTSTDELFKLCGYASNAETDEVEKFFVELRQSLQEGKLTKERIGDFDYFSQAQS